MQQLVRGAMAGNSWAQQEFFNKLSVRFSRLIALELRKYPVLTNEAEFDERVEEICRLAIEEVKKWCPLCSDNFSFVQISNVLRNVLETYITNWLTKLAKTDNLEAESLLFSILRKKLMERASKKRGKEHRYEND